MQRLSFTFMRFKAGSLILGILLLACGSGWAFTLSIPEDVNKLPEEKQIEWIQKEMTAGHEEQIKIGKERHVARIEEKKRVSEDMVKEAENRRRIIRDARVARERRDTESQVKTQGAYFLAALILIPGFALYLFQRQKSTRVEVPERSSERTRQTLQTSQSLMDKLKRKKDK